MTAAAIAARSCCRRAAKRRPALSAISACRAISATRSRSPPAWTRRSGEAIVVMDADLQDPPEVVAQMIAKWREGYDVVYARRLSREGESRSSAAPRACSTGSSASMSSVDIPRDVGDFRLIDRKVLDAFRADAGAGPLRARHVRLARLPADRGDVPSPPRAAGETKYPLCKMLRLAVERRLSAFPTRRCGSRSGRLRGLGRWRCSTAARWWRCG